MLGSKVALAFVRDTSDAVVSPPYTALTKANVTSEISTWSGLAEATATKYNIPYGFGTAVLGADGMLYCAPRYNPEQPSQNILRIDPITKTTSLLPIPAEVVLSSDATQYSAGIRAMNNIIVFPPYNNTHILFVDTISQTVKAASCSGIYYYTAVSAPNGLVYALDFTGYLTINPITKTSTYTSWSSIGIPSGSTRNWEAGVVSVETDRIYFGPYLGNTILTFDYANTSWSTSSYGLTYNGPLDAGVATGQIIGGTNGGDGKIYWRSRTGVDGYWTVLDPSANTAVRDFGEINRGGTAVVLGPDGNAWCLGGTYITSHRRSYVETIISVTNGSLASTDDTSSDIGNQAVLHSNGNVYLAVSGNLSASYGILLEIDITGSAIGSDISGIARPPYF